MAQISAKKAGFSPDLVKVFNDDFKAFKDWYDSKFIDVPAKDVWKKIGGTAPKTKKVDDNK
jgi:hypothetical protein